MLRCAWLGEITMTLKSIENTIKGLCQEITKEEKSWHNWKKMSETELLREMAICIFSSQIRFELSEAVGIKLYELGLLELEETMPSSKNYCQCLVNVLSEPVYVVLSGQTKKFFPRFKNRWANLLSKTLINLREKKSSISIILNNAESSTDARRLLTENIWGFGPKQSSLYLRRVGYCSNMAVIDTHIVDFLSISKGMSMNKRNLSRISFYEEVENHFKDIAEEFGYPVGTLDLATWVTMRVAKRENILCHS